MKTKAQIEIHIQEIHNAIALAEHDAAFKRALEPFAKILLLLAEEGENQTMKIINLTRGLFWLTVVLCIFTIVMMVKELLGH